MAEESELRSQDSDTPWWGVVDGAERSLDGRDASDEPYARTAGMFTDLRLVLTSLALLACGGVERRPRAQPTLGPVALPTSFLATLDAGGELLDAPAVDAAEDAFPSESTPDALPRCADLDPTPASCAASHPGRRFARCRWTVGPVYACGRGAPPPSARALVCVCNGCQNNRDCLSVRAGAERGGDGSPWSEGACMELGYPCGPLARVCVNHSVLLNLDEGAYHDDHGHLRLGAPQDYAGRTPALRAPCAP
ncbi:MAG: hypothetical protein JWM10_421 [Myxococcaceae bacterium]|nr:hypothetical protein [Myxococcaceae bacterium]